MSVSVLMPFRDARPWIEAAVESVLTQAGVDFELVAVDDGSCDGSREWLQGLGDRRLRIVENREGPGIVGALETARKVARGDWLARMDADDRSRPGRLLAQWQRARQPDAPDVVACRVRLIDPLGQGMEDYVAWTNRLTRADDIALQRFVESPLVHPSTFLRAAALAAVGGYRRRPWAEDHDLWLRLLADGYRIVKIPEVGLDWRDSAGRLTRSDARYTAASRMKMRSHFLARLAEVREHGVAIAGAGPIGKRLARHLGEDGVTVHGFFDVHPRRIGQRIHGRPVASAVNFAERWSSAVLLGAVGRPGKRQEVRTRALAAGRVEGTSFWSVC